MKTRWVAATTLCSVVLTAGAQSPSPPATGDAAALTAPKKPFYTNAALFTTAARPFSITRTSPEIDAVIPRNVKLESLGDRFGLTEGPSWIPDGKRGYLVVSDLIANVIYKIDDSGRASVFLDKAGYSGDDINNAGAQTRRGRAAVLMIGPNGTTVDAQGRLIWCAANDGAILRLEKDGATRTVLASGYEGKRFDGPNDVVAKTDGAMYLTDGDWGLRGNAKSPLKQLAWEGVYLVKDGKVTLLLDGKGLGGYPNGVALSPDEKTLYLTSGPRRIMKYDIQADDTIGPGTVFVDGAAGLDGMRTDRAGNLYSTNGAGPGVVLITSAAGKELGKINLPVFDTEPKRQICATNVAFGGLDGQTLYIAACEAVYRLRIKTPGVVPGLRR